MNRIKIIFILLFIPFTLSSQNSKQVKALKQQRDKLQQQLKKSQQELERTKKNITQHKKTEIQLGQQMETKLQDLKDAETQIDSIENSVVSLQGEVDTLSMKVMNKKDKYCRALRMARAYRHETSPTMFILSGKTILQMTRRARNTNTFAGIMRTLGEDMTTKQSELLTRQNHLLSEKTKMNTLMQNTMLERQSLGMKQREEKQTISTLSSKQQGLQSQLTKQRNQLAALNKKIDQVIAAEIEAARKRAEAERKRREEAERKKKQQSDSKSGSKSAGTSSSSSKVETWLTPAERVLNGSFEQNKGRLPVPITGAYKIGERFGIYNVPGMSNVQLDNKGTNYIGQTGAKARCVFDGEVTAVFQFYGTKGVLVRHGSYISVYCNLSSVNVSRGMKIKARDIIGAVALNEDGKCVLHFQLRKETAKLNPELWIAR